MQTAALADNRRSAYRVRPISTDKLALALVRDNLRHIPDEIADVTCNGASVRFAKETAPKVANGEEIMLSIESPSLNGGATITAKVVFSGDSTTERLIGLAFETTDRFGDRVNENFFELFNRRVAYRGGDQFSAEDLVAAIMPLESAHNSQLLYPVSVRNISATGISLCVSTDPDNFMRERAKIRLALRFPGQQSPHEIVTRVCYRSVAQGVIYYGCHFDWQETTGAIPILEDLTAYTLDRLDHGLVSANH